MAGVSAEVGGPAPVDLGTLGGPESVASDINDAGLIVGASTPAGSESPHAVTWEPGGGIRDIGGLGGVASYAHGVNEAGLVVGASEVAARWVDFAFAWDELSGMRDLSGGLAGGMPSVAADVNERGQIVGYTHGGGSGYRAVLWEPDGTTRDLGTLGGLRATATAIHDTGRVVGWANLPDSVYSHAFVWDPATGAMEDLGTLGGGNSWALDINEAGQVVGKSEMVLGASNAEHAFLWDPATGVMEDLGTLGGAYSTAFGLNDVGQVVGSSTLTVGDDSTRSGFVWDRSLGMRELGTRGGRWAEATAVNNSGRIVGMSHGPDGPEFPAHAVVWSVPPPADHISITVTGRVAYIVAGPLRSGNMELHLRGDGSVRAVRGAGVLTGPTGADVSVTVDISQIWVLPIYAGAIRVSDPATSLRLWTPVLTNRIDRSAQTVGSTAVWIETSRFPWVGYWLTWHVTDNT